MVNIERKKLEQVLKALENLKEVVAAAQALGIKAGATGKDMRLGESFLHDDAITAINEALAQPEQKQTGIREIRVTETVKPERKPFTYYDPVRDAIRPFKADGDIPLYTSPPVQPEQEPVADGLVRQYINSLVANKPDEAANATKAMVDYVYTSPPAQPKQEPVAWMCAPFGDAEYEFSAHQECENCVPCYATPPKPAWVGLMVAEMEELTLIAGRMGYTRMLQLAEAKLKEKNT